MNNNILNFLVGFDAIFCINLDRRKDRWESVKLEFKKINIENRIIRFSAIETPENGQIGCLMSHISILEISKKKGWKNVFIFEDDAKFVENEHDADGIILPKKWELFYLGGSFINSDLPYLKKYKNTYSGAGIRGTHAIGYSETMVNKILTEIGENNKENIQKFINRYTAIDSYYSRFLQKYGKTFISSKIYFKQRESYSDIEKKINNYDKVVFTKFNKITKRRTITNLIIEKIRKILELYWKWKISFNIF